MPARRFTGVRTPRKEKVWATQTVGTTPAALTAALPEIVIDLLSFFKLDVGVSSLQRVTVMRMIGSLFLGNGVAQENIGNCAWHWGITWVPRNVSDATAGDGQIPDPAEQGARETQWIQRGVLRGIATAAAIAVYASAGQLGSHMHFDITQMRKQPAADHVLVLIGHHDFGAAGVVDPKVWLDFNIMLALP